MPLPTTYAMFVGLLFILFTGCIIDNVKCQGWTDICSSDFVKGTCYCELYDKPNMIIDLTKMTDLLSEIDSAKKFSYTLGFCMKANPLGTPECEDASCCQVMYGTTKDASAGDISSTRFGLRSSPGNSTERYAMIVDSKKDEKFWRRTVVFLECNEDQAAPLLFAEDDTGKVDPDGFNVYFLTASGKDFCPMMVTTTAPDTTTTALTTPSSEGTTSIEPTSSMSSETTTDGSTASPESTTSGEPTSSPETTTVASTSPESTYSGETTTEQPTTNGTTPEYPPEQEGLSAGSIMLITVACVGFVYFVGGFIFLAFIRKATGVDRIPNYKFWSQLPGLIQDGGRCICGKSTGRRRIGDSEDAVGIANKGQFL